jgi:ribosomal protein S6--L-glutamate ligase
MRVCFLMERASALRSNPVFTELFTLLARRGVAATVRYPEDELIRLDTLTVDADLYLLKSDTELSLSLATALEALGARVLNRAEASARAKDRIVAAAVLHRAGVRTPRSLAAEQPARLASHLHSGPLILKAHRGYHGAGLTVVDRPDALPAADMYGDVVFAQRYLDGARADLRVFAIGDEIFGVRKSFSPDSFLHYGDPERLSSDIDRMARVCGEAFGLDLYGLDIAEADDGPYVVDINYFPGYRGVPDAAQRLADHIVRAVRDRDH